MNGQFVQESPLKVGSMGDLNKERFTLEELRQRLHSDFTKCMVACTENVLSTPDGNEVCRFHCAFLENYDERVMHAGIAVDTLNEASMAILPHIQSLREKSKNNAFVQMLHPDSKHSPVSNSELHFSNQVFVYCNDVVGDLSRFCAFSRQLGYTLRIRDFAYWKEQSRCWSPEVFICHDSRNKQGFVEPLANALIVRNVMVWYDRFCINVGDSLIEKIDEGLSECKFGALVVSPEFLERKPWSKREFKSLVTRELHEDRKILLPIWLDVSKEDVAAYSPELADKFAIDGSLGAEKVAAQLAAEVRRFNKQTP